jgi:hypothetical protein
MPQLQPARTAPSETKLPICIKNLFPLWNPPADAAHELRGQVLLFIDFGAIGCETARSWAMRLCLKS